jgi:hypothetical protein
MQKEEGEVGHCASSSAEKIEEVRGISAKPEREEEEGEGGGGGGEDSGSEREAQQEKRQPDTHTLNRGDQNVEEAVKYDVDNVDDHTSAYASIPQHMSDDVDQRDAAEGDTEVGGDSMHNEVLAEGDRRG